MNETSALSLLHKTLRIVLNAKPQSDEELAGSFLMKAMGYSDSPEKFIHFYELLSKAEEEARSIKGNSYLNDDLQVLSEFHVYVVVTNIWNEKWRSFTHFVRSNRILNILNSLSRQVGLNVI